MRKKELKKILFSTMSVFLFVFFTSCQKKVTNMEKTFPELITGLTSYHLSGELTTYFPSGEKKCMVDTYYKAPNYYHVELLSPNSTSKQVMIKNGDGVFVVLPEINKTIKVNSTWPTNASYPYLLESISKDLISEEQITKKDADGEMIYTLKTKLFEKATPTKEEISFSKTSGLPTKVCIYDETDNLFHQFIVSKIEQNPSIDTNLFKVEETISSIRSLQTDLTLSRAVTYPTYFPEGTALKEEIVTGGALAKLALMKFSGSADYTIIEKYVAATDTMEQDNMDGSCFVFGNVFALVQPNLCFFYENGVEYTLASTSISCLELLKIGTSLPLVDEKK